VRLGSVSLRAERCLSNYLLFEKAQSDPKLNAAVQMTEQLKHLDLHNMVYLDENDHDGTTEPEAGYPYAEGDVRKE
jgi:hypothetical protein